MFSALTSVWDLFPLNNRSSRFLSALTQTTCLFCEVQYFYACCVDASLIYWTQCSLTVFVQSELWTVPSSQDISVLLRTLDRADVGFFMCILFLLVLHCFDSVTQIIFCTSMYEPESTKTGRWSKSTGNTETSLFFPQMTFMHLLFQIGCKLGTRGEDTQ